MMLEGKVIEGTQDLVYSSGIKDTVTRVRVKFRGRF